MEKISGPLLTMMIRKFVGKRQEKMNPKLQPTADRLQKILSAPIGNKLPKIPGTPRIKIAGEMRIEKIAGAKARRVAPPG
jgi:hypothetical protein